MSLFLDDHSRVVLKSVRDIAGSDYINANYVDVSYFSSSTFTTIIINDIYPGSFTHPKVVLREVMHPIKLEFGNVSELAVQHSKEKFAFCTTLQHLTIACDVIMLHLHLHNKRPNL